MLHGAHLRDKCHDYAYSAPCWIETSRARENMGRRGSRKRPASSSGHHKRRRRENFPAASKAGPVTVRKAATGEILRTEQPGYRAAKRTVAEGYHRKRRPSRGQPP